MNRDDLLQLAEQHHDANVEGIKLARSFTNAQDVQSATDELTRQVATLDIRSSIASCTAIFSLGAMFTGFFLDILTRPRDYDGPVRLIQLVLPVALLFFFAAAPMFISMCERLERSRKRLNWLKPVVSSTECARALKYIEAGAPEVLAWHTLAVAERGVLCEFDVAVLRDLHYAAKAARADEAARQKLYARPAPDLALDNNL